MFIFYYTNILTMTNGVWKVNTHFPVWSSNSNGNYCVPQVSMAVAGHVSIELFCCLNGGGEFSSSRIIFPPRAQQYQPGNDSRARRCTTAPPNELREYVWLKYKLYRPKDLFFYRLRSEFCFLLMNLKITLFFLNIYIRSKYKWIF